MSLILPKCILKMMSCITIRKSTRCQSSVWRAAKQSRTLTWMDHFSGHSKTLRCKFEIYFTFVCKVEILRQNISTNEKSNGRWFDVGFSFYCFIECDKLKKALLFLDYSQTFINYHHLYNCLWWCITANVDQIWWNHPLSFLSPTKPLRHNQTYKGYNLRACR